MTQSPFDGPDLQDKTYTKARMAGTHFDGCDLTRARFYAVLRGASFVDTTFEAAHFSDVNLSRITVEDATLRDATLHNVTLENATIRNANLTNLSIRDANLTGMTINGVLVSDLFAAYENTPS